MSHVMAVALKSFQLGKEIKSRRSQPFPLSPSLFVQLQARGLVEETVEQQAPKGAAGMSPSASPVVPASPKATAKQSESGAKRAGRPKKEQSA